MRAVHVADIRAIEGVGGKEVEEAFVEGLGGLEEV